MVNSITINPVGVINATEEAFSITIDNEYLPALTALNGFSHIQVVWWGNLLASPDHRKQLTSVKPYKTGPESIGVFATRSPFRPNPILITTVYVQEINFKKGTIVTPYIDAEDKTPVLDIKPYHPCERIRDVAVPGWCSHWPKWDEDAMTFDWQAEFNFPG